MMGAHCNWLNLGFATGKVFANIECVYRSFRANSKENYLAEIRD